MKVTVNEGDTEELYPKLMRGKSTGCIYLMESPTSGTVVRSSPNLLLKGTGDVGSHCKDLEINYFADFRGSITLSND